MIFVFIHTCMLTNKQICEFWKNHRKFEYHMYTVHYVGIHDHVCTVHYVGIHQDRAQVVFVQGLLLRFSFETTSWVSGWHVDH